MLKWLFGDKSNIQRENIVWNLIAAVINASEAIIILMLASRFLSQYEVGLYSFAFTLANVVMCIGKYGVRNFHVSDYKDEYSFKEYLYSRIISCVLMLLASFAYVLFSFIYLKHNLLDSIIIIMFVLMYLIEAFEDVFISTMQKNGRLDIGMKIFSLRWFIVILIWGILICLLKNSFYSISIALIINVLLEIIFVYLIFKNITLNNFYELNKIFDLLKKCFPLFVSGFLSLLLPNIAKFFIDIYLSNEIQAIYGYISMPIFIIDVLAVIIYQPYVNKLSEAWNLKEYKLYIKYIFRISMIVIAISIISIVLGMLLGIPVLSFYYNVDLSFYYIPFNIILLSGSFLAFTGLFSIAITIMRKQYLVLVSYVIDAIISFVLMYYFVNTMGMQGAVLANLISFFCLLLFMLIIFFALFFRKAFVHE